MCPQWPKQPRCCVLADVAAQLGTWVLWHGCNLPLRCQTTKDFIGPVLICCLGSLRTAGSLCCTVRTTFQFGTVA